MSFENDYPNARLHQRATREFIRNIDWRHPIALTLTLKQRVNNQNIDHNSASKNFRHFMNRLNANIFKNAARRYGKGLKVVPIIEHSKTKRFHYHAIIERPPATELTIFDPIIRQAWRETTWGYREIKIKDVYDDGWFHYITKLASKPNFSDAIDWENFRID